MSSSGEEEIPQFYLKPGEMYLGESPAVVSTLLGSCVSVVMYSRRRKIGAISHSLLPVNRGKGACTCTDRCTEGFRYVECSIHRMLKSFLSCNIPRGEIEVKVFGGSDMFTFDTQSATVGRQNIDTAMRILEAENLQVHVSDVGGQRGRKLFFYTHTGEVLLKRLNDKESLDCR
ncbi:chemotaxis protein CheD [Geobacter sp. DSM 9736]|uniref:chemotaxis protein CheD n=1 Tax=Geobacter sp. DSM 9736 TaxID=1277350 RepID=UPI000B5133E3|nr:chemotaxis protein CheD [Geobacter sp. DSM 9736]SNB44792.1 chemotaxis protein CheD [Geobacter sp. DSM 9736]